MTTPTNYIATWFYKESKEDASFYPQAGKRGDSCPRPFHLYADTSADSLPLSGIITQ